MITSQEKIIHEFYEAFAQKDHQAMVASYHPEVVFEDPIFGKLSGELVSTMWKMLLSSENSELHVTHRNVQSTQNQVQANWRAEYLFGSHRRKVINEVYSIFLFEGDKIVHHKDHFDVWRWSRQALGASGLLLGWTPFLRKRITSQTHEVLDRYIQQKQD